MKTDNKRTNVTLFDVAPIWVFLPAIGFPVLFLVVVIGLIVLAVRMVRKAAKERRADPDEPADNRRDR